MVGCLGSSKDFVTECRHYSLGGQHAHASGVTSPAFRDRNQVYCKTRVTRREAIAWRAVRGRLAGGYCGRDSNLSVSQMERARAREVVVRVAILAKICIGPEATTVMGTATTLSMNQAGRP